MMSDQNSLLFTVSRTVASLRKMRLLRTALGSLGLKICAAGVAFLNGILLARLLGPAEFGVYSIALSLANLAATAALLGLPMLVTREVAASAEHERWSQLKGMLLAAHQWSLVATLTILCALAIALVTDVVSLRVSWIVVGIAMAIVPLLVLNQLRAAILRGFHWVILADIPDLLLRPVMMFVLLLACTFFTATQTNAGSALGMQFLAIAVALVAGTWWLTLKQPMPLKDSTILVPQRTWLLSALPFLGIALISVAEGQLSLYLLGYWAGPVEAGLFQAASQLVGLIAIGLVAVNMPLQPKLAAAWARGDTREVQSLTSETARMATGIGFIGSLFILSLAEVLLRLYGQPYVEAALALRILAIGQLVNAVAGPCGILLMMTGHQRVVMRGTALALLLNISVAYLAIPMYGVAGGAIAAMLGVVSWNIYFSVFAKFKLGINTTIIG